MMCDRCGQPSVYHSTLIVNGVTRSVNLCRDCAIKEGVFNNQSTNIFDDLFTNFADMLDFEETDNISCPVCKTSLREFKTIGLLGCPNCYEVFRNEISKIIKRIAPNETHKQETVKTKPTKPAKLSKEEQIKMLKEEMKQAIQDERYEDCAKLKKQIAKLEDTNE